MYSRAFYTGHFDKEDNDFYSRMTLYDNMSLDRMFSYDQSVFHEHSYHQYFSQKEREELINFLKEKVDSLPKVRSEVLWLYIKHNKNFSEMATILGKHRSGLHYHFVVAVHELRQEILRSKFVGNLPKRIINYFIKEPQTLKGIKERNIKSKISQNKQCMECGKVLYNNNTTGYCAQHKKLATPTKTCNVCEKKLSSKNKSGLCIAHLHKKGETN